MNGAGTIILLGGINDMLFVTRSWQRGFEQVGVPHRIERFIWQQGLWATLCFADLWNTRHHHREAHRLADHLRNILIAEPDAPVHIIAHSAGTAITAYALEQLGPTDRITSAVLVGSALSPNYDLSRAVQATEKGVLSIESYSDCFFLGIGTLVLGTADRVWTPAAGMVGFRQSKPLLTVHRWRWSDLRSGWIGGHLSIAMPGFVRRILVPWLERCVATSPLTREMTTHA